MLTYKLQELLHISWRALEENSIVDVDNDLLKIIFLLLPLKFSLSPTSTILAEIFVEAYHSKMFEIIDLYIRFC